MFAPFGIEDQKAGQRYMCMVAVWVVLSCFMYVCVQTSAKVFFLGCVTRLPRLEVTHTT